MCFRQSFYKSISEGENAAVPTKEGIVLSSQIKVLVKGTELPLPTDRRFPRQSERHIPGISVTVPLSPCCSLCRIAPHPRRMLSCAPHSHFAPELSPSVPAAKVLPPTLLILVASRRSPALSTFAVLQSPPYPVVLPICRKSQLCPTCQLLDPSAATGSIWGLIPLAPAVPVHTGVV